MMLKNYLKTAFRNLYFNKTQTIIKTVGLAIALCVSIAIFSWVKFELSYDGFHKDADNIYRIVLDNEAVTAPPGFKKIFDRIPGIENSVRLFKAGFLGESQQVSYGNKIFTNDEIYYSDDEFFKVFSFPLLRGNPDDVLKKTNTAIITESTAKKYFGSENPVGKILMLSGNHELEVTGVMKNIPANSHFHFDILINMKDNRMWNGIDRINFGSMWIFPTYLKINPNTNIETVRQKIIDEIQPYQYKPEVIAFQKLKDIHLHSAYSMELEANGDMSYVYLFSIVGILIIIMSSINYINLTTAQAFKRIKEIGIRKTVGALKHHLIFRFLGESITVSVISFLFAVILLELVAPLFMSITGVKFFRGIFNESFVLLIAFLFTILIGALTGIFPAIVLAKQNIMNSIKSGLTAANGRNRSRAYLVVFQFCISIILIASSLIIYNQMDYIRNKKLGYDKDQVLVLNIGRNLHANNIDVLKKSVALNSNISGVTVCSQLPTDIKTGEGVNTEDGKRYECFWAAVDKDFFKTMKIKFDKGENRIDELSIDQNADLKTFKNKFVVNQTFLKTSGIKIGDTDNQSLIIRHGNMEPGSIIGVVEDFHFESLHDPIRPLVFEFTPMDNWLNKYMLVRINANNISGALDYVKQQWKDVAENIPFDYFFLDDEYNSLYKAETQTGSLFALFTFVSILIIVLGLLGLIAFIANQKTKEIGIRKVLGASIGNILLLLSKKFIAWVLIANIIAIPVAYYFMNKWLQSFAYRVEIGWWVFALSGGIALLIALATVSFQAVKAAIANPVEALRYE